MYEHLYKLVIALKHKAYSKNTSLTQLPYDTCSTSSTTQEELNISTVI